MLPPQQYRIVSDRDDQPEAFIPTNEERRSLAVLRDLIAPSPETLERRRIKGEAYRAERQAKRDAEVAAHLARHAALLTEHAASPILAALLVAHAPQVKAEWTECDGCASYWDHDEYGTGGGETQPQWPCPTWSLIEQGA